VIVPPALVAGAADFERDASAVLADLAVLKPVIEAV
jgi:hypothetical protein